MKKVLSVFLALIMVAGVFSCVAVTVNAAPAGIEVKVDGVMFLFRESIKGGAVLTSYADTANRTVVVPEEVTLSSEKDAPAVPVIAIDDKAFVDKKDVSKIILPDTIESIGKLAFKGCTNLTEIEMPDNKNLVLIPESAFSGCISLTSVDIPSEVKTLQKSAFSNCTSLTSVVLPEKLEVIDKAVFSGCKSLTNIVLPESLREMGDSVFSSCKSLRTVNIPSKITVIPKSAFSGCIGMNKLTLPSKLKRIEDSAFSGCSMLPGVYVPEEVEYIGKSAFSGCTDMITATFPKNLEVLSNSVLSGCKNLKNFDIPEKVQIIEANALKSCASLESLVVPESTYIIETAAFSGCSSLKKVNIPEKVTTINANVFAGCKSLGNVKIPNGVTNIGSSAFQNCKSMTKVTLPDSVLNIREGAFSGCDALKSVKISNNCETINANAFSGCKSLKKVSIPESVAVIGSGAFSGCTSMESVTIKSQTSSIADTAFSRVPAECVFLCSSNSYALKYAKEQGFEASCIKHQEGTWKTTKKATVYSAGVKKEVCPACGVVFNTASIPQLKCKAPEIVKAKNVSGGVNVSWKTTKGADKFKVYRKTENGKWTYLKTVSGKTTNYTDKGAKSGIKYWYAVRACNEAGNSKLSDTVSRYYLATPTLKTATVTSKGVSLEWSKVKGASGYVVYRKTGDGSYQKIKTENGVSNLSYRDTTAKKGKKYTYKVKAVYSKTYSAYSNGKTVKK